MVSQLNTHFECILFMVLHADHTNMDGRKGINNCEIIFTFQGEFCIDAGLFNIFNFFVNIR